MKITSTSKAAIIIPKNETPRERFAADELSKYIAEIFGCKTEISSSDVSSDVKFLIGSPTRNQYSAKYISADEFDKIVPGPEGMYIKAFDDALILAGSNGEHDLERGTVYAVYEFLERFLGVSFGAYTHPDYAGGEEIPNLSEKCLCDIEYIKPCADLLYRTAIIQFDDERGAGQHKIVPIFLDWLVKNRYNRILTWCKIYDDFKANGMLNEAIKRGINFTVGHHSAIRNFLPPYGNDYFPEHYYETHPEFYKLQEDGTRFVSPNGRRGQWILCSRNEELVSVMSENIIKWIGENPLVDVIALWPQDGMHDQCKCPECSKHTKVENYAYFLNAVAKRVSAVYPNAKINMLAYVDLWEPSENLTLEPCLNVSEALWAASGLRAGGKADGSCLIGTHFEDNLLGWKKLGAEVTYYDYYMGVYQARQRWIPMAEEMQVFYKRFMEVGIAGSGTQVECFNVWNNLQNFYCFSRTAYDTSLSLSDNLDRLCRIFGNGGEFVKEIMLMGEAAYDGEVALQDGGKYMIEHIDCEKVYDLFEKAYAAAETPAHRNNVRLMRLAFRYTDIKRLDTLPEEVEYKQLKPCEDPTGELCFMTQFSSFLLNNPGFGIAIPLDAPKSDKFVPDKWYDFEKK